MDKHDAYARRFTSRRSDEEDPVHGRAGHAARVATGGRLGPAGRHAAAGQRVSGEPVLREAHRRVDREGQQRRQGRAADQLHRRAEGDPDVRGRQGGADRRGRHRLQHRRLLHQRHARSRHPQAVGDQRGRAAPERRLRPHQQDLGREGEHALPRQGGRVHAVPPLPQQEDRQARPHRPEDPHHAGVPRVLPGDERRGDDHRARARSTPRSSAA